MIKFLKRNPDILPNPEVIQTGANEILADEPHGLNDEFQYVQGVDLRYEGRVSDLRQELTEPVSHAHAILTASRLMRAGIDRKIKTHGRALDFDEIAITASIFLALFRQDGSRYKNAFLESPVVTALKNNTEVKQLRDPTTSDAMDPSKIDYATRSLGYNLGDERILFLTLCHGGLIPGAAVYANHQQSDPNPESFFYPIRFSRAKHNDKKPRLTNHEKRSLERLARDRAVIIFDEDIATGKTISRAEDYVQETLGKSALVLTTYDARKKFSHFDEV